MPGDCLRWNVPKVTSELFDDEVVIVNFESGRYHSVRGAGVVIWNLLREGATRAGAVAACRARYTGGDQVDTEVLAFLDRLVDEHLAVANPSCPAALVASPASGLGQVPFEPPVLTTFSDMQDLLLLDPIHDVDDDGWPTTAK
jgi:hypothetical protein